MWTGNGNYLQFCEETLTPNLVLFMLCYRVTLFFTEVVHQLLESKLEMEAMSVLNT